MKLGFIGMGAMGNAIASGLISNGFVSPADLFFTSKSVGRTNTLTKEHGVVQVPSNAELLETVDVVVLAVKPKQVPEVSAEIGSLLQAKLLISIAGGVSIEDLSVMLGSDTAIVRVMPNINALVGQSMSALCPGDRVSQSQRQLALDMFNAVGQVIILEESLFSVFTAVAGCAPAWTFAYVEALAKAGVAGGLTKAQASASAAQMLLGSALMLQEALQKNQHPSQLIDRVTSPGGSTIAGLLAGEDAGFSAAVVRMVAASRLQDSSVTQSK